MHYEGAQYGVTCCVRVQELPAVRILLLLLAHSDYSEADETESRAALVDFYAATHGEVWNTNTGWNSTNSSYCDWYGVTCSDISTDVTNLYMYDNGLAGTITSQLALLDLLQRVDVSQTLLSGTIPQELSSLTALQRVYGFRTSLSGTLSVHLCTL